MRHKRCQWNRNGFSFGFMIEMVEELLVPLEQQVLVQVELGRYLQHGPLILERLHDRLRLKLRRVRFPHCRHCCPCHGRSLRHRCQSLKRRRNVSEYHRPHYCACSSACSYRCRYVSAACPPSVSSFIGTTFLNHAGRCPLKYMSGAGYFSVTSSNQLTPNLMSNCATFDAFKAISTIYKISAVNVLS